MNEELDGNDETGDDMNGIVEDRNTSNEQVFCN
jgi:hypothetical protein